MTIFFKPNPGNNNSNNNSNNSDMSGDKIAVCCGINDYPGSSNDLNGCVNDANDWSNLLKGSFGFQTKVIVNSNATWRRIVEELKDLVAKANEGKKVVFTYSGHGSNVPDQNNDESDTRDECLCLYDKWLIDDDIRGILSDLKDDASFTFISDSCHSATVTRQFLSTINIHETYSKPRYLPAPENTEDLICRVEGVSRDLSEDKMKEIFLSGCLADEYSYDAYINGSYNGAMSYHAIKIIKSNPNITWNEFHRQLRGYLPSAKWPQTPQLEGKEENKNKSVFR